MASAKGQQFFGIQTILVTPFQEDYSLDLEGLRVLVDHVIAGGVHGIICTGSNGEFSSLSDPERIEVWRHVVKYTKGRVPVIACSAHSGTDEAVRLTREAERSGADAVMVNAPYYLQPTEEGIFQHFKAVAEATHLPVMVYNTPTRQGVNITPKLVARLATIENVVAVKQGTRVLPELIDTVALAGDQIAVLSGFEGMMLPCFALGMVGTTATSSTFMPKEIVQVYDVFQRGDLKLAQDLFFRLNPYFRLCPVIGLPVIQKEALRLMGLPGGPVRRPLLPASAEHRAELKTVLQKLGLLS